jgi:hypothetical protein
MNVIALKELSVTTLLPTYFISHGGGPWTHMKRDVGDMCNALEASLQDIPRQLGGGYEAESRATHLFIVKG